MRHVISRLVRHLEAEKNVSATTIETYQYDLHKIDPYLVKRLGKRFLPGDVIQDRSRYRLGVEGLNSTTVIRIMRET